MPEILDLKGALDRLGDDKELLKELVGIFADESVAQLAAIQASIDSKSAKELETSAHSIKGALGNIGAMSSHAIAFELEKQGRAGDLSQAPRLFEELKAELAKFNQAFAELKW